MSAEVTAHGRCINAIDVTKTGMVRYELYFKYKIWRILMVDCINGAGLWRLVRYELYWTEEWSIVLMK